MTKSLFAALVLSLIGASHAQTAPAEGLLMAALAVRPTAASPLTDTLPALRATLQAASWPADIVRAADRFLQVAPEDREVQMLRTAAAASADLLRRGDVALFRSSFDTSDPALAEDIRRAARGDRAAAVRLAQASRAHDEAHGTRRYVGWMQYAALLGDAQASYELARHFRRDGQLQQSAAYEAHAIALGHVPAASLDHRR